MENKMHNLTKLEQAIVIAHSMRRFTSNFKHFERTANLEKLSARLSKFLHKRERTNRKNFIMATEFERVFWTNVTQEYNKKTKILALDFISQLYSYYGEILAKYSGISPKLMQKIDLLATDIDATSDEIVEMESNDDNLLATYVTLFEPYSGISLRKSLFSGKKLTIKNNLILEGKTVDVKFA